MTRFRLSFMPILALSFIGVIPTAAQTTDCETGFRPFDNAFGTTCIPENPQRIAVFDATVNSLMIKLDMHPVAHFGLWINAILDSHPELTEQVERVMADSVDVGSPFGVNLEAILAAQPDLIVTPSFYVEDVYEEVSAIAPVVGYDYYAPGAYQARPLIGFYSDALGITEQVDPLFADYDARIEALRLAIEENAPGVMVSVIGFYYAPDPIAMLNNWVFSDIMREVGIRRPEQQALTEAEALKAYGNAYNAPFSLENLQSIDADKLIVIVFDGGDELSQTVETGSADFLAQPVFQSLNAAQNDEVHLVSGHWVLGGFYDMHKIIDDLFRIVAEVDPTEVSPNPFLTASESS